MARVSGEAAPLLFTALNRRFFRRDIFQPVASPTVQIYNHAVSPYDERHQRLRRAADAEEVLKRSAVSFQLLSVAAFETFKL